MIEVENPPLSISKQCELLGISRASAYYVPVPLVSADDQEIMNQIDLIYTRHPYFGSRRMMHTLNMLDFEVGREKVVSLMRLMGLEAVYPGPNLSKRNKAHKVYPYLLRRLTIDHPNQVWGVDITYIRLRNSFVYLYAILDWYSRYVIDWELSDSLDSDFCVRCLRRALKIARPEIENSDQGCQFTSEAYLNELRAYPQIKISMDGRGRALDNRFTERLWRSVKYEEVYLKDYEDEQEARKNLKAYFRFYNLERPHQGLDYQTPIEVHLNLPREVKKSILV